MINLKERAEVVIKSGLCTNKEREILDKFLLDVEYEEFIDVDNIGDVEVLFVNDEDYIDNIIEVLEVLEDVEDEMFRVKFRGGVR